MQNSASDILKDLLLVRAPVIAVVDRDRYRAAEAVRHACRTLRPSIGGAVEWTLTHGWRGPESIMSQSGLMSYPDGGAPKKDIVDFLGQLLSWCASATDGGRPFPFARGTAIMHDGDTFLSDPVLRRILEDAPDTLDPVEVSLVLVLAAPMGRDHPLRSSVVQVDLDDKSLAHVERYGEVAQQLLSTFGNQWPEATIGVTAAEIAGEFAGLSLAEARAVARLAVLEGVRLADGERPTLRSLVQAARNGYAARD